MNRSPALSAETAISRLLRKASGLALTAVMAAGNSLQAQDTTYTPPSNLVSYFDKILIKVNASTQTDDYALRQRGNPTFRVKANNEYKTFLSLDYEFVGVSYGFSPRFLPGNNDDELKGRSSFTDFRVLLFPRQWLQTASFGKTRGYYVENTGDYIPNWQRGRDPYLQLPNLKNVSWSFSTAYIFNRDFSFKNLVYQTQWQHKSCGSFVPALYYAYNRYSFDLAGTQALEKDFDLRLAVGYYYTFIIKDRFFIAPNLAPSLGLRFSSLESTTNGSRTTERPTYFTRFLEGGLKAGFNSRLIVAGAGLNFNINWYDDSPAGVTQNNKLFGIVYFGYRFNAPDILSKAYEALNRSLPH